MRAPRPASTMGPVTQTQSTGDPWMTPTQRRRAKRTYIRLAAHLAAQPPVTDRVTATLSEIEQILDGSLPPHAAFPFWWNNEGLSAHSRAWLSSGWEVELMDQRAKCVTFVRRKR